MRNLIITVRGANVSFASRFDQDADAMQRLRELVASNAISSDFAKSISTQRTVSPKQNLWVHYIVWSHETATSSEGETVDLVRVVGLLHLAREAGEIKRPRLRLQTATGRDIVLKIASSAARYPGSLDVLDVSNSGRIWLGRVPKNGKTKTSALPEDVIRVLSDAARDPEGIARLYGQRTGRCCFCGIGLIHTNSVELGYGPICAEKWGMFHSYVRGAVETSHALPSEIIEASK